MDAVKGTNRSMSYDRTEVCPVCKGTGGQGGSGRTVCNHCRGTGMQGVKRGNVFMGSPCPHCDGAGSVLRHPCEYPRRKQNRNRECGGQGSRRTAVTEDIKIPKGVDSGTVMRIRGMGHGTGDLLVHLRVGSHSYFRREGYDIHTDRMITISQAVLGGSVEVLTLYGKRPITVRPGTASNAVYKIPGFGISYTDSRAKGDHYVHISVKVPSFLNHKQRDAMKAYAAVEEPVVQEEPDI